MAGLITSILTPAQQNTLTTVARIKAQQDIASSADDAVYAALLPGASAMIAACLGWEPYRAEIQDRFAGPGWEEIALSRGPLVQLGTVALDGDAVSTADQAVTVSNALHAVVSRAVGWSATSRPVWTVDYFGGWLVPEDDFTTVSAAFANTGQTITLASGAWPLLVPGDRVTITSAAQAANNRTVTVLERTSDSVLTAAVGSGLVDESAGATVDFAVSNLPPDIERATVLLMRDMIQQSGTTATPAGPISSIKTTGVAVTFAQAVASASASGSTTGLVPDATLLAPWSRVQ